MNHRGFTLLEMIGVITLLAILALMITPKVEKVIKRSEIKTSELSIESLVNTAKQSRVDNGYFDTITLNIANSITYEIGDKTITLKYEGAKPTSGVITIDSEGDYSGYVVMRKMCFTKELNEDIVANDELSLCQ